MEVTEARITGNGEHRVPTQSIQLKGASFESAKPKFRGRINDSICSFWEPLAPQVIAIKSHEKRIEASREDARVNYAINEKAAAAAADYLVKAMARAAATAPDAAAATASRRDAARAASDTDRTARSNKR